MSSERPKVAVVGSGFGGLATAIRLQAQGCDVTVLEKRNLPGGRAYVYRQDGFTFDAGPTVITAPGVIDELFELAGKRREDYIEFLPVHPLYRLSWDDGFQFNYTENMEETLAQIAKFSPKDVEGYKKFHAYTKEVFEEGYVKLAHVPFLDWGSMLKVAPQLMKLQAFRSVYSMVSHFIEDKHLREAFSFHSLLVGGNPFTASSIYTLIHFLERKWGVFFPKGGTHALVRALVKLFTDLGGKIEYDANVDEIVTDKGKVSGVRLRDGFRPFTAVVSNADVMRTYQKLLRAEPRLDAKRRQLDRSSYSMSLFLIYFGTNRRYPNVAHHNVLFGPRYKELLKDIFKRGVLADDFSLYLHAPTQTDPSMAPEGCESFYVLSPVPHLGKLDVDWNEVGPKYADLILSYLERKYLPGLKSHIVTQRIFTPLDFDTQLDAHLGSAFSLEPLLRQSAYFRTANRDPRVQGLYFAGAGTHPGAGIPGVVSSAKATAGLVLEDLVEKIDVTTPNVADECRKMIQVGSKSFSFASTLFNPEMRDGACFLYGWCRFCDDSVDDVVDPQTQTLRVLELKEKTLAAFEGKPGSQAVFIAIGEIAKKYKIPSVYALDLIEGLAMDARRERYETLADLNLYCYRVAGCVGLMMVHVMGVSDEKALLHAAALGRAMQLTNISRDVLEDAAMGRVYLPLEWLREEGVDPNRVATVESRKGVAAVTRRLLAAADAEYQLGNAGLKYLPLRAAFAVAVASSVYSEIGRIVLARREHAWDERAVTSRARKIWCVARGIGKVLKTLPYRFSHPWKTIELQQTFQQT